MKHVVERREFDYANAVDYLLGANRVIDSDQAIRVTRKDGATPYYLESSNEFVVVARDTGYIRTYMRPEQGASYFWDEAVR